MTRRPFRKLALRFLVWRYGRSVNWNCSFKEAAQATGLSEFQVTRICRVHGYPIEGDDHRREFNRIIAVDSFIAMRSAKGF